jgi:hypothetical protein
VANEDVWTFMSYAHDDDLPTSDSKDEEGFVTFLHRMLELKLRDIGAQQAKIWRDRKRYSRGDQYDVEIEDALKKSALLIVIVSSNWMQRPYCGKELDEFVKMRQANGATNVEERIVVVCKGFVEKNRRPPPLRGQEGFAFYERDAQDDVSGTKEFFNLGKAIDDRFYEVRDALAKHLQKRVERIASSPAASALSPPETQIAAANGRIVYLAKPAGDMDEAYNRLAKELQGRGYGIVPDISSDIPKSSTALAYIDEALAKAELSIHLLGERRGFAPDDEGLDPIVKLQLARARERGGAANADQTGRGFRRIVWAPKALEAGGPAAVAVKDRDPLEVLARFDTQVATDKIDGDILGKFVEFLFQYLVESAPRPLAAARAGGQMGVYLAYNGADEDFALQIAEALQKGPLRIQIPVSGEPDPEARRFNAELLARCDAVTLCWANASEVWVRSEAYRLNDWQSLGRKQQFSYRSLVAGPPPGPHKMSKAMKFLFQDGEFDIFVDLVDKGPPTADLLSELAPHAKPAQP